MTCKFAFLSSAAAIGLFSGVALAQEPAAAPPEATTSGTSMDSGVLGDIIVTARRRDERVQDVPLAVSVVGADTLRANSVTSVLDVARNVPAFQMVPQANGKNSVSFTIRSQRQSEQVMTQDGSVGVYFADVVLARIQGANGALFDLNSVQVLKGPQGTLFGRNTTGGAVLMSPQAPTDRFEGYLTGGFGNYDRRLLEGAVNIPLADWAQLRVGGQIVRRDGYVKDLSTGLRLEDTHTDSYRISLRLTPVDGLQNDTIVNSYRVNENGSAPILDRVAPPATTLAPGLADALARQKAAGFFVTATNDPLGAKIQSTVIANTTTYDIGSVTFKNIFGYRYLNSRMYQDEDGSPFTLFPQYDLIKARQYSDEFQVLGKAFDDRLDYIFGLYWFREDGRETNGNAPLGRERSSTGDIVNTSKSVFGQLSYKLLPNLSATFGGRQTWDRRSIDWNNIAGPYGGPYTCALTTQAGAVLSPCTRSASTKFSRFTYTASLDWHPTEDVLVYVTHRQGYRAGGYNLRANTPAQAVPFRPENVKDYEIGIKTDWSLAGVRGRFNVAAYHQDYSDIQRQTALLINGVFAGSVIQNAAKAKIDGVEVEATIVPVEGLELSGFFSYSNPRYTSYPETQNNGTVIDIKGAPFAGAPKYSGGGSIRYTYDAGDTGTFVASANVYAQSFTYGQDGAFFRNTLQPQPLARVDGWAVTNTRLEWNNIADTKISTSFFVKNLFDRHYDLSTLNLIDNGVGMVLKWRAEPRTYGFDVRFDF